MSRYSFNLGYSSFVKSAGLEMLSGLGSMMTSLNVNTDVRNRELDEKIDAILNILGENNEDGQGSGKIQIVGEDQNAKDALKKKKRLLAQALIELNANGKI